jgi:hypothetical protein
MFVLAVTAGRRMPGAAADLGGIEIKLNGGAALTSVGKHGGRLWLDFAAGIVGIANRGWNNNNYNNYYSGDATAIRSGGDLALLLGWPVWRGRLYAGPLASLDMVWLEANSNNRNQHEIHFGSAAGLRAGYQYLWRNHLFVRADVTGCAAIVRNLIVTQSAPNTPLFESPPAYLTLALGVGIWF